MVFHARGSHVSNASSHQAVRSNGSYENESSQAGDQRLESFYNDAELTELAVPPPAPENDNMRDTYEKEEELMMRHSSSMRRDDQSEGELTEIAASAPISHPGNLDEDEGGAGDTSIQSAGPVDGQDEEQANQAVASTYSAYAEFCTVSWLVFFSLLGTLARLGVQAISTYPNAPFASPVLWANLGGSLFLGFLLEDRRMFRYSVGLDESEKDPAPDIDKMKKTLPLYIGLATGFCGSFTSFSTFITDAFLALSNELTPPSSASPYHVSQTPIEPRSGGYSFMATTGVLIIQTAVNVGALKAGAHIAVGLETVVPILPTSFLHRVLDPLSIPLGWGCWLGAVFLTIWTPSTDWRYRVTFALILAPPGALLRFYISKHLNGRIPAFPLGTFVVNIFGTVIEGMCMDLQHSTVIMAKVTGSDAVSCAVLEGIMHGFCGCTTTVSTWVSELNGLRRRHAWLYGIASVAIALAMQVLIMGSMIWTIGYDQRCSSHSG